MTLELFLSSPHRGGKNRRGTPRQGSGHGTSHTHPILVPKVPSYTKEAQSLQPTFRQSLHPHPAWQQHWVTQPQAGDNGHTVGIMHPPQQGDRE